MVSENTITVKNKDCCRQPKLSMDSNNFRSDTTRLLGEHLGQVLKNSTKWSRRRFDNEVATVLSKGQFAIFKMAAVFVDGP